MTERRTPGTGKTNPYSRKPWDWRPYSKGQDGVWRWDVDPEQEFDSGWRAAFFFEAYLRHTKGRWRGLPFRLLPFELAEVLGIYGPTDSRDRRLVKTAYIEHARKSGKSEKGAGHALQGLVADGEQAAEVYGCAFDRDQAALVYRVAADMVDLSPELSKLLTVRRSTHRIIALKTGGFYRAIPSDAAGSHGFNASRIVFDEIHTQRNRELWDVMQTSMGTREQPLTYAITTAGHDKESICYELHDYAVKVQKDVVKDESWYVDVRNTPEDADWREESHWSFANPALGDDADIDAGRAFRRLDELRRMAKEAEQRPALINTFRNLYLNQWTASRSQWIDMGLWDQGGAKGKLYLESELDGEECFTGIDLSSIHDVTAVWHGFPQADGSWRMLWRFWLPEAWVEKRPNHPLSEWARRGWVKTTDGDVIDFGVIQTQLEKDAERFQIRELGFDPWQSTQLVQALSDGGMTVAKVPQGMATLTDPTKEFERLVAAGLWHHNNNPVARWMVDNVTLKTIGDQIKPEKSKSMDKIDGVIAAVNGLERSIRAEPMADPAVSWL